jgi:signal transduction histidine kinase
MESADFRSRLITRRFAGVTATIVVSSILAAFVGMGVFRCLLRDAALEVAATDYARVSAFQISRMIGESESEDFWQLDGDGLSHILSASMRVKGIARMAVLGLDGGVITERAAATGPTMGVVEGRWPIVFNGRTQGWVLAAVVIPSIKERWGSPGFLTLSHLITQTAGNYGILVSQEVSALIDKMDDAENWPLDAEKISAALASALPLEGVTRIVISDVHGNRLAVKDNENGLASYVTDVRVDIIHNNAVVGQVAVFIDFPGIASAAWRLQGSAVLLGALLLSLFFALSVRTVSRLEGDLAVLYRDLEARVEERTGLLVQANSLLQSELEERKRLESTLTQSEKLSAVGQLAAGVAHEINNPLGVILGFAQAARRRLKPGDELELPVRSIEREAERCARLVKNLLTFSRQSQPHIEELDLNETTLATLSLVETRAKVHAVEVRHELAAARRVRGDRVQLQQVVLNLCNNAVDAIRAEGGRVVVRTRDDGAAGAVVLEVEDNGTGIPEDALGKIFNPFFTTKEVGKGTGLGLSLVHEIVERHGGSIAVRSRPGEGTMFTVTLPAGAP